VKRGVTRVALRRRAAAGVFAGAALWLGAGTAGAEVIDLQWKDGGHFERSLTIAPGKFAEICGPLQPGQSIRWSFKADRAVNFNIHYHVGQDVRYPAKNDQIVSLQGDLAVDSKQDYCWMWVNKTATGTKLTVAMTRKQSRSRQGGAN
jgi:hypothetical protein